jgi:hypothetical protein
MITAKFFSLALTLLLIFNAPFAHALPLPLNADLQTLDTYTYDFGQWPVGTTAYKDLYFSNNGSWPLYISGIYISGISYQAIHHCPVRLQSGYRCMIRVIFQPWNTGYFNGQLDIQTDRGPLTVLLGGWGY